MSGRLTRLGVIPARSGSKEIPRKNIKPFLGRPLLCWTVETAKQSEMFDRLIVSTDDDDIASIAKLAGAEVPFRRPRELAEDTTPTAPVIRHAVEWVRDHDHWLPGLIFVLEPTAPSRQVWHIREAAQLLERGDGDSLASVSRVPQHYVPGKQLQLCADGTLIGLDGTSVQAMVHRRQDLPPSYAFNGLIFACKTAIVLQDPPSVWGNTVLAYVVDSKYAVDIDSSDDWVIAEGRCRHLLEEAGAAQGSSLPG